MTEKEEKIDPALELEFVWQALEPISYEALKPFYEGMDSYRKWFNELPSELKQPVTRLFTASRLFFGDGRELLAICNDTFAFACADCEEVPLDQVRILDSLNNGYGYAGVAAWVAHRRRPTEPDIAPIDCPCHGKNPVFMEKYNAATAELKS